MESKKGTLIIISGLSGTGKSYFQDIILGALENCKGVPKYTTRNRRVDDDKSIDFFGVDEEKIKSCTWKYSMNGNKYGIMIDDIKRILEARR